MPLYEYACEACGTFTRWRELKQSGTPADCPVCGQLSPKVFSLIHLRSTSAMQRMASERNERSAHAPHVCSDGCPHQSSAKSSASSARSRPALQFSANPNRRPWMLGH